MDFDDYSLYFAVALIGYLLGSIPFGLVLGRFFKVEDLRTIGSGNIGATNALRTGNKKFAIAVLLGDGLKGVVAVLLAWLIAHKIGGDTWPHAPLIAGLAAIIGHIFPVWLKFKGGKGVATAAGIIMVLHWPTGLACLLVWLVAARLSRLSSLGAVMAAIHAPIYAMANGAREYALPFMLIGLLLLWTHRSNIRRMMSGEESTIKVKSS
jgi:glycerol-3-phosphate acyltransferase PlsY